jgi:hypothetical protein
VLHHAADIGIELPQLADLLEMLDQQLDRQAALHLELAVDPRLGLLEHFLRQIRGNDLDAPSRQGGEFLHAHCDRIWFLPGRGRRAPDAQGAAAGARLHQRRQYRFFQMIERNLVAKEERLVGGHRFDHLGCQRLGSDLQLLHQLPDSGQTAPSRQRDQSALDQILLVGGQVEAGSRLQKLTQELIIQRRHERSPENNRTSFGAI